MTIVQLVTKRQFRGAEVFAAELSALLGSHDHRVIFAGLYSPGQHPLVAEHAENIDLNGQKSAFSFSLLRKLVALIRETKPDIIQANGSDTLKYAAIARRLYFPHIPLVYRNISMVSSWTSAGSMRTRFQRMLFRQVGFVASVGPQSLEDLVKTYHYPAEQTKVIRRGIPDLPYDHRASRAVISRTFDFSESDPVVMHIGQFSDEKNHDFLIDSFSRVLRECPSARLVLIGEGKRFHEIAEKIRLQKLDDHIFLAGHRSPVQEWLAGADLFILGSTIEGVPGVILEAGMQSVPSVAVNVGGVKEVVRDGETGLLLAGHDPEAFSRAIIRLLTETDTRKKMGSRARDYVVANYSLESCLRNFEDMYRSLLKGG